MNPIESANTRKVRISTEILRGATKKTIDIVIPGGFQNSGEKFEAILPADKAEREEAIKQYKEAWTQYALCLELDAKVPNIASPHEAEILRGKAQTANWIYRRIRRPGRTYFRRRSVLTCSRS